jgi:hypothetical protein
MAALQGRGGEGEGWGGEERKREIKESALEHSWMVDCGVAVLWLHTEKKLVSFMISTMLLTLKKNCNF